MNTCTPDPKPWKHKKKKRKKDEAYLSFIRSQPCLICNLKAEPHHEPLKKGSGMARKGPDRESIPLCRWHHTERGNIGKYTFAEKYNIDYAFEIDRLNNLFDNKS